MNFVSNHVIKFYRYSLKSLSYSSLLNFNYTKGPCCGKASYCGSYEQRSLYSVLPLLMKRVCFWIRTHANQ